MRHERHNLHGTGYEDREVYDMEPHAEYWPAVTDVPCPVEGCDNTVVWYEAGYVPGYRACMLGDGCGNFLADTLRHRFLAQGNAEAPTLVRDDCCE